MRLNRIINIGGLHGLDVCLSLHFLEMFTLDNCESQSSFAVSIMAHCKDPVPSINKYSMVGPPIDGLQSHDNVNLIEPTDRVWDDYFLGWLCSSCN